MLINPYSDEYFIYDFDKHQYILTPRAILDKLNVDLTKFSPANSVNRERDAQIMCENISDEIYNEIYEMSSYYLATEWICAKCESARKILMLAMLEQVKYFMFNGSISVYSGVDFKKNVIGESAVSRILAPNAKRILNRIVTETGLPLTYCGSYSTFKQFGNYKQDKY